MNSKVFSIFGDKHKKREPSEHIMNFPGGHISIVRTSNNEYWAHIWVNQGQVLSDVSYMSKSGEIVESRLDYSIDIKEMADYSKKTRKIEDTEKLEHIAIRIKTS